MIKTTKITSYKRGKLEEAFLNGLSDHEACIYADVDLTDFSDYCTSHPEFSARKEVLKDAIKMHAKINLAREIRDEHDVKLSLWYLQNKCTEEFSSKKEATLTGEISVELTGDIKGWAK